MFTRQIPKIVLMGQPTLETATTIAERITAARLAKGFNKSQLMRAMGVAYTTVHAWETGKSYPDSENLNALSVVLGVSTSVLRGEGDVLTEPQYEAWLEFLKSQPGESLTEGERSTLASIRIDPRLGEATVELYRGLLLALRMAGG